MDLTLLLKGTISREISYFSYHSSGFSRVTFLAALSSLARRTGRTCTHREINKKDTWGFVQMKWFKSDIRILDSEEGGGPRKRRALNPNQVSVFVVFLRRSSCGCNSNCLPLIIIINRGKKEEENLFINSGTLSLSLSLRLYRTFCVTGEMMDKDDECVGWNDRQNQGAREKSDLGKVMRKTYTRYRIIGDSL